MYKVYNISWGGLWMHVATFNTKTEAQAFINKHKDYTLKLKEA